MDGKLDAKVAAFNARQVTEALPRFHEVLRLREQGLSMREIGKRMGDISPQRVDRLLKRAREVLGVSA